MNARMPSCLCLILCGLASCVSALAEEGEELRIDKRPADGYVAVYAHNAPVNKILGDLARCADVSIVFKYPVNTPMSFGPSGGYMTPLAWARQVAAYAGMRLDNKPGLWDMRSDMFCPIELSQGVEDMKREPAPHHPGAVAAESPNASGALLFFGGYFVPGPFKVISHRAEDGSWSIQVNGIVIDEGTPHPPTGKSLQAEPPSLPESGQFTEKDALSRYVHFHLYPRVIREYGRVEAMRKIAEFVESQLIVERVVYFHDNFYVTYASSPGYPIPLFSSQYSLQTGVMEDVPYTSRAASNTAENSYEKWVKCLSRPSLVVMAGVSGGVEVPLQSEIGKITSVFTDDSLSQTRRDGLLTEVLSWPSLAREIIMHNSPPGAELLAALDEAKGQTVLEAADAGILAP